jgi:two-component system, NtrC family, sensor kinase
MPFVTVRAEAMKKRSRVGGEQARARPRKASKPKGRSASKALPRRGSSPASQESEVARLTRELNESLEREAAIAEVLQVINSSPGDLAPVFDALLDKAMRLCEATFGGLMSYDGERFHTLALRGLGPEGAEAFREPGLRVREAITKS